MGALSSITANGLTYKTYSNKVGYVMSTDSTKCCTSFTYTGYSLSS